MLHDLANDGGYVALKWAAEDREGWRHGERMSKTSCEKKTTDDDCRLGRVLHRSSKEPLVRDLLKAGCPSCHITHSVKGPKTSTTQINDKHLRHLDRAVYKRNGLRSPCK